MYIRGHRGEIMVVRGRISAPSCLFCAGPASFDRRSPAVVRTLRVERPGLPVLLVTGYSQYGPEVAGEAFELLEKPYRRETLVNAVRAALDRRERASGGIAAA
jgi:DNA-binding NtrC family response regulator